MKWIATTMALLTLGTFGAFAQDTTQQQKPMRYYTGLYNQVPENFNFPVIGFVNIGEGNQHTAEIGFTNVTQKNMKGAQVGFSNITGEKLSGVQVGFINMCRDSLDGVEVGFVNVAGNRTEGAQVGFVNLTRNYLHGAQVGYVNVANAAAEGAQVGFVNACKDSVRGMQIGYVNVTGGSADGVQIGFVNGARRAVTGGQVGFVNAAADKVNGVQIGYVNAAAGAVKGSQIGFINVCDTISNGIPIGFFSVVRRGGFKAFEASSTELYPANLAFKTGVDVFYTTFIASYNPDFRKEFALGAGVGTNLKLGRRFFLNPEALSQVTMERHPQHIVTLNTMIGFSITKNISLVAGPDVVWIHRTDERSQPLLKPQYSFHREEIDSWNSIHVGAKAALRVRF
jgi:hypothetical protein